MPCRGGGGCGGDTDAVRHAQVGCGHRACISGRGVRPDRRREVPCNRSATDGPKHSGGRCREVILRWPGRIRRPLHCVSTPQGTHGQGAARLPSWGASRLIEAGRRGQLKGGRTRSKDCGQQESTEVDPSSEVSPQPAACLCVEAADRIPSPRFRSRFLVKVLIPVATRETLKPQDGLAARADARHSCDPFGRDPFADYLPRRAGRGAIGLPPVGLPPMGLPMRASRGPAEKPRRGGQRGFWLGGLGWGHRTKSPCQ